MFTGAYVTQGPRSLKEQPPTGLLADFPTEKSTKMPPNPSVDQSLRNDPFPDVSQVSLQLTWSPPTPFSLPATPRHSPFLYPDDIPDYEFVDARVLGYEPQNWPEFESQLANSRLTPLPSVLDNYAGWQADLEGSLLLTSVSVTVHFAAHSSRMEGISPSLLLGRHQLAYMSQDDRESQQTVSLNGLDRRTQELLQVIRVGSGLYHVDFPIHLPTEGPDHAYLANGAAPEHHVKCRVEFHVVGGTRLNNEMEVVSKVYHFSGQETDQNPPELLEYYQEATPLLNQQGRPPGILVTHGLATLFSEKLWGELVEGVNTSDNGKSHDGHKCSANNRYTYGPDLSRYRIVQHVFPRSYKAKNKPLLTLVYSPRLVSSLQGSTARLITRDPVAAMNIASPDLRHEAASPRSIPTPVPVPHPKQANVPLRRSSRSSAGRGPGRQNQQTPKTPLLRPTPAPQTAGPVRNTRSHSRNRSLALLRRPESTPSPLAEGTKLPLTPRSSPLVTVQQQPQRNPAVPTFHPSTSMYNPFTGEPQSHDFTPYGSMIAHTTEGGLPFDSSHVDSWSSIMGAPGAFPSSAEVAPTHRTPSTAHWTYPRDSAGGSGQQTSLGVDYHSPSEFSRHTFNNNGNNNGYYGGPHWP